MQWTETDLLRLIESQEKESLTLDYKSSDALQHTDGKKNELCKDVSAFANSAGGALIYGVVENGHVPTHIDSGFDPSVISKEWIEQVLNSRIQRRIDGIVISQVELPKTAPGRVAYVITVPQSMRAPHQAFDKRFYKRFNFESVPMEEYEVRDSSRRGETPNLSLQFSIRPNELAQGAPGATNPRGFFLEATITNESPTPANYVVINFYVDARVSLESIPSDAKQVDKQQLQAQGQVFECSRLHKNHGIPGMMPIFEGAAFSLFQEPLRIKVDAPGTYLLACELNTPGVPKKMTASMLAWDGARTYLFPVW